MKEIWKSKTINGREYWISNLGNVKTNKSTITFRKNKDGYLVFTAGVKGHRVSIRVHRLVAELFVPNPDKKQEVNHLDFDRSNARADNLCWCTHAENVRYSKQHHSEAFPDVSCGNNPNARLTTEDVVTIRILLEHTDLTVADIARVYQVGWQTINHIKHRNTWKEVS